MAGSAGAIRAGRAFVELNADSSKLVAGLKRAESSLKAFGSKIQSMGVGLATAGAAILAPLGLAVKSFTDTGSALVDMSARTGASVESLSALGFAASQTGADMGDVEIGMKKMQQTIDDAARGSKTAQEALARFGLTAEQLVNKSPDEQFMLIAKGMKAIGSQEGKVGSVLDVMGKSGTKLIPMLSNVDALTKKLEELGGVISTEDATAADDFGDLLGELQVTLKAVTMTVGSALVPVLTDLANMAITVVSKFGKWMKQNKGLVVTVAAVGAVLVAAGVAAMSLGIAAMGLNFIISGTATVFALLGTIVAALFSPLALIVMAIAAVGLALLAFTDVFEKALAGFNDFFGGVVEAIQRGDIMGAFSELGVAIQRIWINVWAAIMDATEVAIGFIQKRLIDAQKLAFELRDTLGLGITGDEKFDDEFAKKAVDDQTNANMGMRQRKTDAAVKKLLDDRIIANAERELEEGKLRRDKQEVADALKKAREEKKIVPIKVQEAAAAVAAKAKTPGGITGTWNGSMLAQMGGGRSTEVQHLEETKKVVRGVAKLVIETERMRKGLIVT